MRTHPPGKRAVELAYSASVDGNGPGWVWEITPNSRDLDHVDGGFAIFSTLCSSIK